MTRIGVLLGICWLAASSFAQEACPPLSIPQVIPGSNMFNAQQEVYLGEAIAASIQQSVALIKEPELTNHLQGITDRLAIGLPAGYPPFHVVLVDLPVANAFSVVGGHIYVGRKLIALAQSEDEIAGIMGHEMGHVLAHHEAIQVSDGFRRVLKVQQVDDRDDVFAKWNEFISRYRRGHFSHDIDKANEIEEREQLQADLVGLYLVARGGYSTQAFAEIFDRLAETKGKTGNFFSDLFGITKPDSKRLRDLIKSHPVPPSCEPTPRSVTENFNEWKNAVLEYSGIGHKESLPGLISKRFLAERLRPEIERIRISPDGKYVLAQDDSNIFVLTRDPLRSLFHIEAPDSDPAQFTPDSKSIVFQFAGFGISPRVERWDIATQKRRELHEVPIRNGCLTSALAPDGNTTTCVTMHPDSGLLMFGLTLYDVATGKAYWENKNWVHIKPTISFIVRIIEAFNNKQRRVFGGAAIIAFSPDGHYLVAHSPENNLCMNLVNHMPVELPSSIKGLLNHSFTFLGNDRLFGVAGGHGEKSELVEFPSGRTVYKDIVVGNSLVASVAHGDFVLARPMKSNPVGLLDLKQNKFVLGSKRTAMDVWENQFIAEKADGNLAVFEIAGAKTVSDVSLPEAPLGAIHAAAIPPELSWLAVSGSSRGAFWNLQTGQRLHHIRGFTQAYFASDQVSYAEFPKYLDNPHSIAAVSLKSLDIDVKRTIEEDDSSEQLGPYILTLIPSNEKSGLESNVTLEVRDVQTQQVLWTRQFPQESPTYFRTPGLSTLVLFWPALSKAVKALIKTDPEAASRLAQFKDKDGVSFVEVVDLSSGKTIAKITIDTGKESFEIEQAMASDDSLVVADNYNRALVYSFTGEQKGVLFGTHVAICAQSHLLSLRTDRGEMAIYDLRSLEQRTVYDFASRIAFSGDGKRLLVLTAEQTVYIFDLTVPPTSSADVATK
jgi:WD40 repeat protein